MGCRAGFWDIIDIDRQRLDYRDLLKRALYNREKWKVDRFIIEKAASGHRLLRDLWATHGRATIKAYIPRDDKVQRVETQAVQVEKRLIRVPADAPWLNLFRHELLAFPNGWYDDQVDAFTMCLEWISLFGNKKARDRIAELRSPTGRRPRPRGSRFP